MQQADILLTKRPTVAPPPLISHDSHIGYLTSTSPLITTSQTIDEEASHPPLGSPDFHNPEYKKSNTLPVGSNTSSRPQSLAPQHAATFRPRNGERSPSSTEGNRSRGVSPGAKIRDVFTVGSRKKADSPPKSPDRSTNGNPLGSIFNKEKRKSINLGKGSRASESVQSIDTNPTSANSSKPDLAAIVTTPHTPASAGLERPATFVTPPTPTDKSQEFAIDP